MEQSNTITDDFFTGIPASVPVMDENFSLECADI